MTRVRPLVVGTRGSALALRQTGMVVAALHAHDPGLEVEVRRITTKGDVMRDVPLAATQIPCPSTAAMPSRHQPSRWAVAC